MKGLVIALAAASCTPAVQELRTYIPDNLLEPCLQQQTEIRTSRDLADAYIRRGKALNCANGKLAAIKEIVG
jgi:hypothetical protein